MTVYLSLLDGCENETYLDFFVHVNFKFAYDFLLSCVTSHIWQGHRKIINKVKINVVKEARQASTSRWQLRRYGFRHHRCLATRRNLFEGSKRRIGTCFFNWKPLYHGFIWDSIKYEENARKTADEWIDLFDRVAVSQKEK